MPEPGAPLDSDVVIAGHSVGELTAAALAGVLSVEDAIALTAARGRAMAAACAQTPTGMSAVLGGDPDEVLAAIDKHGLTPANMNGAGQIVAAGALDGLEALKADPPAKARIMPLSVAGAFHTEYMASAREELEGVVGGLRPADPSRRLLSNADGAAVDSGAEVAAPAGQPGHQPGALRRVPGHPARARGHRRHRAAAGRRARRPGQARVEGPGRRTSRSSRSRRPRTSTAPASCSAAQRVTDPGYDWRVVVSPVRGTVSPAEVAEGSRLPAGSPLGCIRSRREEVERLSRLRRGTRRVARPRGRPRRRRRPDRPSLPGGRRMSTIQLPAGAPGARILGLGAYRPRRRVTNDDLAQVMDTNDEWIQTRVGIAERRWASEDETLVEMAVAAGGKAIAASGLSPDEIDLVIVASASLRAPIPGIGPQVAHRLGVPRPGSFDLNAGCAGFCYALGVANDSIRAGSRATRSSSASSGSPTSPTRRPDDGGDLRRRRRARRWSAPPTSRASARSPGAATATSTTPSRSPPAARR